MIIAIEHRKNCKAVFGSAVSCQGVSTFRRSPELYFWPHHLFSMRVVFACPSQRLLSVIGIPFLQLLRAAFTYWLLTIRVGPLAPRCQRIRIFSLPPLLPKITRGGWYTHREPQAAVTSAGFFFFAGEYRTVHRADTLTKQNFSYATTCQFIIRFRWQIFRALETIRLGPSSFAATNDEEAQLRRGDARPLPLWRKEPKVSLYFTSLNVHWSLQSTIYWTLSGSTETCFWKRVTKEKNITCSALVLIRLSYESKRKSSAYLFA